MHDQLSKFQGRVSVTIQLYLAMQEYAYTKKVFQ